MKFQAARKFLLLFLLASVVPLQAQRMLASNADTPLPDAPQPAFTPAASPAQQDSQNHQSYQSTPLRYAPRLAKVIQPGQHAVPLTSKDKLELALHEQIVPYAFATEILAAGWEQLLNSNPKYGTDKAGFGERLGAAAIRQSSQAMFADGVLPIVFRQDPRYYRKGSGSIASRILYAAGRVVVGRSDEGDEMPNYSKIFGYAGSAALTTTYYPDVSAGWGTTAKGYGTSLLTAMLGNQVREFGPDAVHLVFHRHRD